MVKLKPCPRCQNEAALHDYHGEIAPLCWRCRISGPYFQTPDEAIDWWNTRSADPLIEELAEKIADHYCKDELLKEMAEAFEEIVRCLSHGLQDCRASVTAKEMLQKYHKQIGEPK